MVQEFQVVRCYSCMTFQTQQVCKKPKFVCKICGEKQSVRKVYGKGSGKDCRVHCQKLNKLRGTIEEEKEQKIEAQLEEFEAHLEEFQSDDDFRQSSHQDEEYSYNHYPEKNLFDEDDTFSNTENNLASEPSERKNSKWSTYLTNEDDESREDEASFCSGLRQKTPFRQDRQARLNPPKASHSNLDEEHVLGDVSAGNVDFSLFGSSDVGLCSNKSLKSSHFDFDQRDTCEEVQTSNSDSPVFESSIKCKTFPSRTVASHSRDFGLDRSRSFGPSRGQTMWKKEKLSVDKVRTRMEPYPSTSSSRLSSPHWSRTSEVADAAEVSSDVGILGESKVFTPHTTTFDDNRKASCYTPLRENINRTSRDNYNRISRENVNKLPKENSNKPLSQDVIKPPNRSVNSFSDFVNDDEWSNDSMFQDFENVSSDTNNFSAHCSPIGEKYNRGNHLFGRKRLSDPFTQCPPEDNTPDLGDKMFHKVPKWERKNYSKMLVGSPSGESKNCSKSVGEKPNQKSNDSTKILGKLPDRGLHNLGSGKHDAVFSCFSDSKSAALRKYMIADDLEDIDFEL